MTAITSKAFAKKDSFSPNKPFAEKTAILDDFRIVFKSRLVSNHIRKEVLMGKAKFGIGGGGKELLQIALAKAFQKGDFFSGYYRDQTFMMRKGLATVQSLFASLYGDAKSDPFSGGRQMNNHFATPFIDKKGDWLPLNKQYNVTSAISPLAGPVTRALGLALASKKFKYQDTHNQFSQSGQEVSFCVIGDATSAEGVFFEAVNAAGAMQVPIVFVIQDDGYGISVPSKDQTTKGSISEILSGFVSKKGGEGFEFYPVKAWNYTELHEVFDKAVTNTRQTHKPCIIHVTECTQSNGHSTSGSHERYKPQSRLDWENKMDCLRQFEQWITDNEWATTAEMEALKKELTTEFRKEKKEAWDNYQNPLKKLRQALKSVLAQLSVEFPKNDTLKTLIKELAALQNIATSDLLMIAEKAKLALVFDRSKTIDQLHEWHQLHSQQLHQVYDTNLHSHTNQAAINVPVVKAAIPNIPQLVNGFEILNQYFDQLFDRNELVYAFGEDVGKIGGVNQAFAGLQEKYGENRIFDTGIREWTIVGQAIGMAMRGLRPIAEIQYLDYLVYALPALTDDLATLRWRTNGQQSAPAIIRTRGHRLEGIWHSGSQMGLLLNSLKGIYLLTPRNMTQAAGMYNTMLQSDDPAIIVECLNGYRKKEKMPTNLDTFTIPLGVPETLEEGTDITLVTYGSCVAVAEKAVQSLANLNISVELIDVQTLMPFDLEHQIVASIKKTNRVIFLDEDVPGGASAYMLKEVLENQKGYRYLDSAPVTVTAKAYRPPYGDDGNYVCKPNEFDVVKAAVSLMVEADPVTFEKVAKNLL